MKHLIIPVAGRSSRFPGVKPKWLLTHPNGNLMVVESISGLNLEQFGLIHVVALKEHLEQYDFEQGLEKQFRKIGQAHKFNLIILERNTKNQPHTVSLAIDKANIEGQIYIKDCDSYFKEEYCQGNFVSTYDLNDISLVHAKNKSYVTTNDSNMITNIVEKKVVSSTFNVGGYGFESAKQFLEYYKKLEDYDDLYVSHIIYDMLLNDINFVNSRTKNYIDWGTIKEWNMYQSQYVTLFIDIDGTLVKNSGEFFEPTWGKTKGIEKNIRIINKLYESKKVNIILTTARNIKYKDITEKQLKKENIRFHQIIYDLYHGKRIIINDYAPTNPYKSCDAINIKRNSSDLEEMLIDSLGFSIDK